ncbi:uncharacterized protein LOC142354844 [Convolutriloba macropyga]|uniref:uncharacterized protein LOC142354844 n=1 Tax=Convolutriloba macropyga TaxID=536237 RepID=UPI003F51E9D1
MIIWFIVLLAFICLCGFVAANFLKTSSHVLKQISDQERRALRRNLEILETANNKLVKLKAYCKNELSKAECPLDGESILDATKCAKELKRLIESHLKFSKSACLEYESLQDSLKKGEVALIMSEMNEFVQNGAKAEAKLNELPMQLKTIREKYKITLESKLARSLIVPDNLIQNDCLSPSEVIPYGLKVYKLPVKLAFEDLSKKIRRYRLGTRGTDSNRPKNVIMMVGMTGAGKSLMINNLINYIYGVQYNDAFRFKLIVDDEEMQERDIGCGASKASSMTSWVTGYDLEWMPGFGAPYDFTLIDTPGFADSKGIDYDGHAISRIQNFFNDRNACPVQEITSIAFVIQSGCSRLTGEQKYVFDQVLNIFGKDMSGNVSLFFTFADAQNPPALECVKSHRIPYSKYFKFNNSALYASNPSNEVNEMAWLFGYTSIRDFFNHLNSVAPASLYLTKDVLQEREKLNFILGRLQSKIDDGMNKLRDVENIIDNIIVLQGTIESNKDHKIPKEVPRKVIEISQVNVSNCERCKHTCHNPCTYARNGIKIFCVAIQNGKCVVCPGQCPPSAHRDSNNVYKYVLETVEETVEDMLHKYNIATKDKDAKKKLLQNLLKEYQSCRKSVIEDIMSAASATNRLDEIAMRNSYLTNIDYIKRLIDSEERGKHVEKENRLKQLRNMLDLAATLDKAKNNPDVLTNHVSEYERSVKSRIEELEEKDETGNGEA